jgi:hypothetical protein
MTIIYLINHSTSKLFNEVRIMTEIQNPKQLEVNFVAKDCIGIFSNKY